MNVRETETRLASHEEVLAKLNHDHPNVAHYVQSEVEARQKLAEVTAQLIKYQSLYGELSSVQPDSLANELQRKEDELRRSRLLNAQHAQVGSLVSVVRLFTEEISGRKCVVH